MTKVYSHRDLIVWKKSMDLVDRIYRVSSDFPEHERFGLTSQIRRAAVSIPSNIAEGRVRKTTKDFIQFLHIASGSVAELETQIEIALRQKWMRAKEHGEIMSLASEIGKMLVSLISSLNSKH
jgi:four helix bundle protein